jgi:hypothetical protein
MRLMGSGSFAADRQHLWVPKTGATWADAFRNTVGSATRTMLGASQVLAGVG